MKSATVALGDYIEQVRGISYKPDEISDKLLPDFIPILRAGNFDENGLNFNDLVYIHKSKVKDEQLIRKGDILLAASSGSKDIVGKNVQFKDDYKGTFGAFCKVVRPKKYFIAEFVGKFFRTPYYRNVIRKSIQGANINNLRSEHIDDLRIPFLEVAEQRRIADLLSKAEALITKRKESIALLDEYLKSVFLEMFGDPGNNYRRFPIGTIRDVITEAKYGTSKPAEDQGEYPYLRMNNITETGYWDFTKLKYINLSDSEKDKYLLKKGDLVFNRTNSKELVGKTGVYSEESEMAIAGYLIRVRPNSRANSWYLWGYLNSTHGKMTLFGMCKSIVGMANINAQELQNIKILIPPIRDQNRFAEIVQMTEKLKVKCRNSLTELEQLYAVLSQKAFSNN